MISQSIFSTATDDVTSYNTAEHFSFKGYYSESIQTLDGIRLQQQQAHIIHFGAAVNILYARNYTQLNNDERARYHLGLISQEVREAYPKIDAEYKTILGILLRRQAYKLLKENGDAQAALEKAEECLELFTQSKKAALLAFHDGWRLYYSAELNALYTRGLIAMITETNTLSVMSKLLEQAVIAEYKSRQHMIPMYRDYLLGATIIIDLGIAAGHDMTSMKWLSDSPEYRVAYYGIYGHNPAVDWATYILLLCFPERRMSLQPNGPSILKDLDAPEHKPDHIAKILVLGTKILLTATNPSEALVSIYSFELQFVHGRLATNKTSPIVRKHIEAAVEKLIVFMPYTTHLYLDRRRLAR